MNNQLLTRAAVIEFLKDRGIAPTLQRVEIGQVLFARPQHLSADQVLAQVNGDHLRVSKATVYNTLGLFAKKGLIREVIVNPTRVFYDTNTSAHHHFYNVDTGTLADIDASAVTISELPRLPDGTVAEGVDVIIRVRHQTG
ncbi:MAG: Fur family transcriptional regulator [Gammaproteobacteria bacterium]|nr:Fur family transcriptional regulator [Gammaproteobacteria bacterium]